MLRLGSCCIYEHFIGRLDTGPKTTGLDEAMKHGVLGVKELVVGYQAVEMEAQVDIKYRSVDPRKVL